jgi:NAD(P)-dependent dehydrogenase (short-subunit alcohol dehydrogenase family)
MNKIDLEGLRAVITGGAQGIGSAIAKRLLASGASISLWDVDEELLKNAADELGAVGEVYICPTDVTDAYAVQRAAASTEEVLGRIDILVTSAGITGPNAKCWDYPVDAWQRVIDVNLNGVFYCCRAVIPFMTKHAYGRIVNIASVAGKEGNPNASAYSASKAGVIALTKSLGKELAESNIAVNCITPSAARTRLFEQMTQEHIDYMLAKIPRGRFVKVEEIASMVAWLVSEENSYTTAGTFDLSGGELPTDFPSRSVCVSACAIGKPSVGMNISPVLVILPDAKETDSKSNECNA